MTHAKTLAEHLAAYQASSPLAAQVAGVVQNFANAAATLEGQIADGSLAAELCAEGENNVQGEVQKRLDVIAHECFLAAARKSQVAWLLSEELEHVMAVNANAPLAVAIDPLDGSSNIAINSTIGTIFAIYPADPNNAERSFLQPGANLLAAGYIIYGAQTELALSVGDGTYFFSLDGKRQSFVATGKACVGEDTSEFAINASNYRFWPDGYRTYFDECLQGTDGPAKRNYNMRWIAAVAGDAHRVLRRGGLYMYPKDRRKGYESGRLRLIYECNPIAFLIEQAGGMASDGSVPILEIVPKVIHQRSGLCFGSANEMTRLARCLRAPSTQQSPLFNERGLFRVTV